MAVAKKQRKAETCENGTKENPKTEARSENLWRNKQPSWLAQFMRGRLRGRRQNI